MLASHQCHHRWRCSPARICSIGQESYAQDGPPDYAMLGRHVHHELPGPAKHRSGKTYRHRQRSAPLGSPVPDLHQLAVCEIQCVIVRVSIRFNARKCSPPVLMQVPSNIVVGKIKYPGIYICAAMAVWGMISACMAAV
jgi:hypothetical protein